MYTLRERFKMKMRHALNEFVYSCINTNKQNMFQKVCNVQITKKAHIKVCRRPNSVCQGPLPPLEDALQLRTVAILPEEPSLSPSTLISLHNFSYGTFDCPLLDSTHFLEKKLKYELIKNFEVFWYELITSIINLFKQN